MLKLAAHMQQTCTLRMVVCPLKCGQGMRHCDVKEHTDYVCLRRFGANDSAKSPAKVQRQLSSSGGKIDLDTPSKDSTSNLVASVSMLRSQSVNKDMTAFVAAKKEHGEFK
jgi:hypothetical protein